MTAMAKVQRPVLQHRPNCEVIRERARAAAAAGDWRPIPCVCDTKPIEEYLDYLERQVMDIKRLVDDAVATYAEITIEGED